MQDDSADHRVDKDMDRLEKKLMATTYGDLFERLEPAQQMALLDDSDAPMHLRKLVQRAASPMKARFLAAELLFVHQEDFPSSDEAPALPAIYAWALADQPTGNLWGLPGADDGQAGSHVLRLGGPVVAALIPLFHDERRLPFGGSIEATMAELWQVRVKDVAASLVSHILKRPFPREAAPAERDAFITELEQAAKSR